jgi:hypothetical protein
MTEARERYETKKLLEAGRQAERNDSSKWWLGQRNPIDRFTGWLVAWTALLCVATVLSAVVLYKTDHTLQRTVVATQRPWISVKVEAGGIRFHSDGTLFHNFKVTLKNVGNSVATFVDQDLKFFAVKAEGGLAGQLQDEMCKGLRGKVEKSKSALALFPLEESDPVYSLALTAKQIDMEAIGTARLLNLMLVGCVVYRSEFAHDVHETGYMFSIRQITRGLSLPIAGRLVEVGKDVPKEELVLTGGSTFAH